DEGIEEVGEALFLHVRYSPIVTTNDKIINRLSTFLNQYGFHRNLSFASLLVAVGLIVKIKTSTVDPELVTYARVAIIGSVLLFYRYLKFFRQYSYELFNCYGVKP